MYKIYVVYYHITVLQFSIQYYAIVILYHEITWKIEFHFKQKQNSEWTLR